MISAGTCIGCTRDEVLRRKLSSWLGERFALTWADDTNAVSLMTQSHSAGVVLLDLRMPHAMALMEWLSKARPCCVAICFGEIRTRPALAAEQLGAIEVQPLNPERKSLQGAVQRAAEVSHLRADNSILQTRPASAVSISPSGEQSGTEGIQFPEIARASQYLEDPEVLLQHSVEMISSALHCSKVCLYLADDAGNSYELRAEVGGGKPQSTFPRASEFVQWMLSHGQITARTNLAQVESQQERLMLASAFDSLKAEAIAPLHGKEGLIGWVAIGAALSGKQLSAPILERLMRVGRSISPPLDKSESLRKSGLRQRLMGVLCDALPVGVVALNSAREIIWLNSAAANLVGVQLKRAIGLSINEVVVDVGNWMDTLHSGIANLRRVFRSSAGFPVEVWAEPMTEMTNSSMPGSFLLILQDASATEELKEQREIVYRREILAEMASSVAFEIRAPLATIKTFTQLLPERAADPSFARRCQEIVTREVDRLSDLSNSICTLSNFGPMEPGGPFSVFSTSKLLDLVRCLFGTDWSIVHPSVGADLPSVEGNCARLAECVCHLLANAREATRNGVATPIMLRMAKVNVTKNVTALEISVSDRREIAKVGPFVDNSHLPTEDDQKRANLRLNFAAEIVREFSGDMSLATSEGGVTVKLLLPICYDEKTADR